MSEKQLMVILALIGIVAFTAWVVHQSIPSAPPAPAKNAATRPAGNSQRPHQFAHAPVSAARAQRRPQDENRFDFVALPMTTARR
jgi:hypothetical protein